MSPTDLSGWIRATCFSFVQTPPSRKGLCKDSCAAEVFEIRLCPDTTASAMLMAEAIATPPTTTTVQLSPTTTTQTPVTSIPESPLSPPAAMPSTLLEPTASLPGTTAPVAAPTAIDRVTVTVQSNGSIKIDVLITSSREGLAVQFGGVLNGYSATVGSNSIATITLQSPPNGLAHAQLTSGGSALGDTKSFYVGSF